jgi:membrane-associated phospholipid phosphatase
MVEALDLQVQIIFFIQNLGSWLKIPIKFVSILGNQEFYLLIAPAIYWCFDASAGLRFGVFLMMAGSVNALLKFFFHTPRPYWVSSKIQPYVIETTFGIPSGHAQNSIVVFGSIAWVLKKKWAWICLIILAGAIGFSRLYLGVHFLSDVLVGWLVGSILLYVALRMEKPFLSWFQNQAATSRYTLIFLASMIVIVTGYLFRLMAQEWAMPEEWVANITASLEPGEIYTPFDMAQIFSYAGALFGLASGAVFLQLRGRFKTQGSARQLVLRYLIGITGVITIFFGLDAIFPEGANMVAYLLRYIRYGLVGAWISALAPLLFQFLKLAE